MTAAERLRALREADALSSRLAEMSPIQRIIESNDPANGSTAVRILALVELEKERETPACPHGAYTFGKGRDVDGGLTVVCIVCGEHKLRKGYPDAAQRVEP